MTASQRLSPCTGLGAVAVVVVVGAALAVIPATALLGALLCVVAMPPAIVSFWRVRKGSGTDRGRAVVALVVAPVFVVCGLGIGVATSPARTAGSRIATLPLTDLASTPAPLRSPVGMAFPPVQAGAPVPVLPAPISAPAPSAVAAPSVAADPVSAETSVAASAPAHAWAPASAPALPRRGTAGGSSCEKSTPYVNSEGACVSRRTAALTAPPGATARCVDGAYSFTNDHQDACFGHGGVAQWR